MKSHTIKIKWLWKQTAPFVYKLCVNTVIGVVLSLSAVGIAVFSKNIIDAASAGNTRLVAAFAALFAFVIILQIILDGFNTATSARIAEALSNNIRKRLYESLSRASWTDYIRYHSEDILTRMTSDTGTVANGITNVLPGMVSLGARLTAAFITLLIYEPVLAAAAFLLGPLTVLLGRIFAHNLKSMYIKIQEAESTYRAYIHEAVQNMLIIKVFSLEKESCSKVEALQNDRLSWIYRRSRLSAVSNSALSFSYWTGYFLAFIWGAIKLSAGAITFGTLTAFLQLAGQVQGPVVSLAKNVPQLIAMLASAERLMEFEEMKPEEMEPEELEPEEIMPEELEPERSGGMLSQTERARCAGQVQPFLQGIGIRFENISFSYELGKLVLNNASFEIYPGETAVILGPSGEGKTTLIRLILSIVKAQQGKVCFTDKGSGYREASSSTRRLVSYVPQGNTLFSGTIAENLKTGSIPYTEAELNEALRCACALDFVSGLPEGINTRIGERGIGLSEGQAQRIAIARALLRKAPILIFDEATSALDATTEARILQSLKKLKPARTCIIVTHRLAALKICSRVLKLEEGSVIEYYGEMDAGGRLG